MNYMIIGHKRRIRMNKALKIDNDYKNGWRYVVWVGGVDDYYTDYDRAKKHYDEWIEQGYDDVVLLDLQNNKELYNSESIKKNRMDYFKEYYNNKGIK